MMIPGFFRRILPIPVSKCGRGREKQESAFLSCNQFILFYSARWTLIFLILFHPLNTQKHKKTCTSCITFILPFTSRNFAILTSSQYFHLQSHKHFRRPYATFMSNIQSLLGQQECSNCILVQYFLQMQGKKYKSMYTDGGSQYSQYQYSQYSQQNTKQKHYLIFLRHVMTQYKIT